MLNEYQNPKHKLRAFIVNSPALLPKRISDFPRIRIIFSGVGLFSVNALVVYYYLIRKGYEK